MMDVEITMTMMTIMVVVMEMMVMMMRMIMMIMMMTVVMVKSVKQRSGLDLTRTWLGVVRITVCSGQAGPSYCAMIKRNDKVYCTIHCTRSGGNKGGRREKRGNIAAGDWIGARRV